MGSRTLRYPRLGLHVGESRAFVRPARAGALGRARPQLDPIHHRPLHTEEEIDYAVKLLRAKTASCASCLPCGRCTRKAWT